MILDFGLHEKEEGGEALPGTPSPSLASHLILAELGLGAPGGNCPGPYKHFWGAAGGRAGCACFKEREHLARIGQ
jgi:hypothetical protein